jgi:CBS domain-containing protein
MIKARELMQKHFVGVSKTTTIASALKLLESAKIDLMPVLDGNRLCGIVTGADLRAGANYTGRVSRVMEKPAFVCADSEIDSVMRVMVRHGAGRLPVVQDRLTMLCIGVISSTDIVKSEKKRQQLS